MVSQKTITQNTTYYTLALVWQKILAFVYFTFLARGLGVEDLGKYTFAFGFTTIFSVLVDVGLSQVLTREIAKFRDKAKNLLSNVLGIKIILSFLVYIIIVVLINLLGYPSLTKNLVYLTGLVMLLDNYSTTFWATLRGHQNLKYESLGISLFQLLIVLTGGILLYFNFSVIYFVYIMVFASTFNFLFSFIQMRIRLKLKPQILFNKKIISFLLKISWPFALSGIFARLNTQIDTVFLSKIGCNNLVMCDENVGIYSIATKITLALHFIPLAFVAAVFPAMSKMFVDNKERLVKTFEKSLIFLMLIGFPIAAGIIALAPAFVPAIFGVQYINSILPLQILMLSLALIFLTFPVGSFLNATGRQLRNTLNVGIAVIINIILNLILIPKLIYTGAAIASAVSSAIILILGLIAANQIIKYNKKKILIDFIKIFLSAVIMAGILNILLFKYHFIWLILIGVIIYVIALYTFKAVTKRDLTDILISLKIKKIK